MRDTALKRAIEKAGGVTALARELGIASQAISQWKRVPADRAGDVERITKVRKDELRPDLWEPPKQIAPADAAA